MGTFDNEPVEIHTMYICGLSNCSSIFLSAHMLNNALVQYRPSNTIQYNTIQYNTIEYNTIQYNTIQYNTIQYNTIQYNTIQYNTIQYNTIQLLYYIILHYITLYYICIALILIQDEQRNWPLSASKSLDNDYLKDDCKVFSRPLQSHFSPFASSGKSGIKFGK